jgi:large subunit ribosomal protein L14
MIKVGTRLHVVDNTGAFLVKCIGMYGNFKKNYASIGEVIRAVVISGKIGVNKKITTQKGKIHKVLIVQQRKDFKRQDGSSVRSNKNCVIILEPPRESKKKQQPIVKDPRGSRILKHVPKELKLTNLKVVSVAIGTY